MKFGLLVIFCGLAGLFLGYVAGFYLGAEVGYRAMPLGATPGDGLSALLLFFLVTGTVTLLGLSGGICLPFLLRRSKRKGTPIASVKNPESPLV